MKELNEMELKEVEGGNMLPVLCNDQYGSYFLWPDGSWVEVDCLA